MSAEVSSLSFSYLDHDGPRYNVHVGGTGLLLRVIVRQFTIRFLRDIASTCMFQ